MIIITNMNIHAQEVEMEIDPKLVEQFFTHREAVKRQNDSEYAKKARAKYRKSEAGKIAQLRYRRSEAGKASYQRRQELVKAFRAHLKELNKDV